MIYSIKNIVVVFEDNASSITVYDKSGEDWVVLGESHDADLSPKEHFRKLSVLIRNK